MVNIFISKTNCKEIQPLKVSIIKERGKQAPPLMVLKLHWQAKMESNGYTFRTGGCTHEDIKSIYFSITITRKG